MDLEWEYVATECDDGQGGEDCAPTSEKEPSNGNNRITDHHGFPITRAECFAKLG